MKIYILLTNYVHINFAKDVYVSVFKIKVTRVMLPYKRN
jgi:hypothetical protein